MAERVAVFLDFQNVHLSGHGVFENYGLPPYRCVPDPARVADLIGRRRSRPSEVTAVRVYRGRPDPNYQPLPAAANDAQAAQWTRDTRVQMVRRQQPLRIKGTNLPYCHFLNKDDWAAVTEDWIGRV